MNDNRSKPGLHKQEKNNLLSDLEDLSDMLDDEQAEIQKELTQPYDLEDLPVLKSFVEDVPTLNEPLAGEDKRDDNPDPNPIFARDIDDSFVDDDPLAISPSVRQQRSGNTEQSQQTQQPTPPLAPQPSSVQSTATTQSAAQAPKGENPFLPQSALDRLKNKTTDAFENKASQELRNLVKQRALPNFDTGSKEYQALRNQASKLVNEVIRLFIPRMEAELRMRLEKEIDEYMKELRKNAQD